MKLSVMSYTLGRQGWFKDNPLKGLEGMCRLAQELNIDGVDMVTTHGVEPAAAKKVLDDAGLKAVCYTFSADINYESAAARAAGVDEVRRGLETASALGANLIMVVTPGKAGVPRDRTRANMIRALQESAASARAAGITMSIENFPGPATPFGISSDVLEAIREVPGLKLTFDNGNVHISGEAPAVSFKRCAEHVAHAHFKDFERVDSGLEGLDGYHYKGVLIGEGVVDQAACLAAMKAAGYSGYINIEYEGDRYRPDEATRRAAAYLRGLGAV